MIEDGARVGPCTRARPGLPRRGRGRGGRTPSCGPTAWSAPARRSRRACSGPTAGSARSRPRRRRCRLATETVPDRLHARLSLRPSQRADHVPGPLHLQGLRHARPVSRPRSTRQARARSAAASSAYLGASTHRRLARHARVLARAGRRPSSTARARRAPTSSTTACWAPTSCTTPSCNDRLDGGAQITASHNPKQYNGIKMVRAEALPLSGDAGIGEIRDMIAHGGAARRRRHARHADQPRHHGGLPREGAVLHRRRVDPAVQGGARRRQRHGRAGGAAALRPPPLPRDVAVLGRSTARSPTTRPTRCSRRTAPTSLPRSCARRPTSASPGTATRTAASSSTAAASSSPATS